MNNKHHLRRVCREHTGVSAVCERSTYRKATRLSSSFGRNLPDFREKDKARNASSVLGFLPQDDAKLTIKKKLTNF